MRPDHIISTIRQEVDLMRDFSEAKRIYEFALMASTMDGDLAEVGVYQGGSAKLICIPKGNKNLHLFDTFEGLPPQGIEDSLTDTNKYEASLGSVTYYLKNFENVYFHKGVFPDYNGVSVDNTSFSFVHLDVDLYRSMKDCLEFFYPRMIDGGVILISAYPTTDGIKKAVDRFFESKPESVSRIGWRQGLVKIV